MPFLIGVVGGLVLILTNGWFSGQHTVGWILLGLSAFIVAVWLLAAGTIFRQVKKHL